MLKFLIKLPFKIIALPIYIALGLFQILGIWAIYMMGTIVFKIASVLFWLAVISYVGHIGPSVEAIYILIVSIIVFSIPFLVGKFAEYLAFCRIKIGAFIKS